LFAGCEFTNLQRVNVIPGVSQTNKSSNFNPEQTSFYNAAAFSLPADFTFPNEGRSLPGARTFAGKNEDFTIGKKTKIAETVVVDFRASFFNAFNRHIFQAPSGFAAGLEQPFQAAGSSSNCPGPFACGFGAVTSTSGPRTIQFGLNITY
jgi:hypothetical protein